MNQTFEYIINTLLKNHDLKRYVTPPPLIVGNTPSGFDVAEEIGFNWQIFLFARQVYKSEASQGFYQMEREAKTKFGEGIHFLPFPYNDINIFEKVARDFAASFNTTIDTATFLKYLDPKKEDEVYFYLIIVLRPMTYYA